MGASIGLAVVFPELVQSNFMRPRHPRHPNNRAA
ncbi:hypothetical protein FHT32_002265 [Variovorax sp. SG517]|nr:hypothetical protein [Variovorax sp. SG517]